MKTTLPRVAYSNPHVAVKVEDLRNSERSGPPELKLEFGDGQSRRLVLDQKQPAQLLKMLIEAGGHNTTQERELLTASS